MLPAFPDCPRRAIAKQYRREVVAAGFNLRETKPSIGAAVGTAVHAALTAKRRGIQPTPMDAFRAEIVPGAEWDATTPSLSIAEAQIERMSDAALALPVREYVGLEMPLRATIADGWELTGQLDALTGDGHLDDLKTGALPRPYQAQIGGYVLLAQSNDLKAESCSTTFIRRVRLSKPQPPAVLEPVDLATAVRAAWHTIDDVRRTWERFASTGDPWTIPANPMSLMCSVKYCPAHGTSFCAMGRPEKERDDAVD